MKRTLIIISLLLLLPLGLVAATTIGTSLTGGPDSYLANATTLNIGLHKYLNLVLNYYYSDSETSSEPMQTFESGIEIPFSEIFTLRGIYALTPKAGGFKAESITGGFTLNFTGQGEDYANSDFQASLAFDYSDTTNNYDVHTDSFTVWYWTWRGRRPLQVPATDKTQELRQRSWSLGWTETFFQQTSFSLKYAKYSYDPDIEADIQLYKAKQSNYILFNLSPGLTGFPKYSYGLGANQPLGRYLNLGLDYLHLSVIQFVLNENGTPFNGMLRTLLDDFYESRKIPADSYTCGLDYFLNQHLTITVSYNWYKEAYLSQNNYYTIGTSLTF